MITQCKKARSQLAQGPMHKKIVVNNNNNVRFGRKSRQREMFLDATSTRIYEVWLLNNDTFTLNTFY